MSLRKAINAFCRQCLYDPHQPGKWREQITACTSYKCALYPVRPMSYLGKKAVLDAQSDEIAPEDEAA